MDAEYRQVLETIRTLSAAITDETRGTRGTGARAEDRARLKIGGT